MEDDRNEEVELPMFKEQTKVLPKIEPGAKYLTPVRNKPLNHRGVEVKKIIENEFEETVELPMFKSDKKEFPIAKEEEILEVKPTDYEQPIAKPKKKIVPSWLAQTAVLGAVAILSFGLVRVILWQRDNISLERELAEVEDLIVERTLEPSNNSMEDIKTEIDEEEQAIEDNSQKEPAKVDYSHLSLVDVDFEKLKSVNPDTQAYIKINNLDVRVPVVQTFDNSYYLSHSFDKKKNAAGWIFGDYRNNWNNLKQNTIIYGHNRTTNVMFGSLKLMYREEWYKNTDNHFIYVATPLKSMIFQIFSVYDIPTETYYLANEFPTEEMYQEFLDTIKGRSQIDFDTIPTTADKILTLSTCRNSTSKTVVHAKLVRIEGKN